MKIKLLVCAAALVLSTNAMAGQKKVEKSVEDKTATVLEKSKAKADKGMTMKKEAADKLSAKKELKAKDKAEAMNKKEMAEKLAKKVDVKDKAKAKLVDETKK